MTAPIKMKAIGFTQSLPITDQDSLFEFETDIPEVKDNDLLVKVSATSINPADAKIRIRNAKDKTLEQPKVLGYDAVGEVIAKGSNVDDFEVGDRVYYAGDVTRMGANAQYQAIDYRITSHAPKSLSDESAAVMPLATLTAWEALFDRLRIRPEEKKIDNDHWRRWWRRLYYDSISKTAY
jgi:NADPH:quinone reductase-like Zn-dependent oxidoreductase